MSNLQQQHTLTDNDANDRVPAPEDIRNSRLFKASSFNNSKPIQGLLPVDHSTAYNPTGTQEKNTNLKHSCMISTPTLYQLWQEVLSYQVTKSC